jgi:beta-glucosidase
MVAQKKPHLVRHIDETRIFISVDKPVGITRRWSLFLEGQLNPREHDCTFEFGLTIAGRANLYVDDKLVIDNSTRQRRGDSFFNSGTREERGSVQLKAGQSPKIRLEYINVRGPADGDEDESVMESNPGIMLGGSEVSDPNVLMEAAVNAAKEADVVIAVVGLNAEWETEGNDRATLALPGRTDELVEKVVAANPKTIVVVQAVSLAFPSYSWPYADMYVGICR